MSLRVAFPRCVPVSHGGHSRSALHRWRTTREKRLNSRKMPDSAALRGEVLTEERKETREKEEIASQISWAKCDSGPRTSRKLHRFHPQSNPSTHPC